MRSAFQALLSWLHICFQILTYWQILEKGKYRTFQRARPWILRQAVLVHEENGDAYMTIRSRMIIRLQKEEEVGLGTLRAQKVG